MDGQRVETVNSLTILENYAGQATGYRHSIPRISRVRKYLSFFDQTQQGFFNNHGGERLFYKVMDDPFSLFSIFFR